MNYKKFFSTWLVVILVIIILIIVLLFVNGLTSKCDEGHIKDKDNNLCYYYNNVSCNVNENSTSINNENACTYTPSNFFDNTMFMIIIVICGIIGFIFLMVFFIVSGKKQKGFDIVEFKKEDFVKPNRAKELWCMKFSEDNNIPLINEKYDKKCFDFYCGHSKQNVFQDHREWFLKFQVLVKIGTNPGVYTDIISLSRGERWILDGGMNYERCVQEDYKYNRRTPIHSAENMTERMMEQLIGINPEKAYELSEQVAVRNIMNPNQKDEQQIQQQPNVVVQRPRSMFRGKKRYIY